MGPWEKNETWDFKLFSKSIRLGPLQKPIHQLVQFLILLCMSPLSPKRGSSLWGTKRRALALVVACKDFTSSTKCTVNSLLALIYILPPARLFRVSYSSVENFPHDLEGSSFLNLFWNCRWLRDVKRQPLMAGGNVIEPKYNPAKDAALKFSDLGSLYASGQKVFTPVAVENQSQFPRGVIAATKGHRQLAAAFHCWGFEVLKSRHWFVDCTQVQVFLLLFQLWCLICGISIWRDLLS